MTIIGSIVLVSILMTSVVSGDGLKLTDVKTMRSLRLSTSVAEVKVINALPVGEKGVEIKRKPEFTTVITNAENGFVTLKIGEEPTWIVEGDLPEVSVGPEHSPFGFHPAFTDQADYSYASKIGVVWDRGGSYLLWLHGQPDPGKKQYEWKTYDEYFRRLPEGMRTLKNITVVFDGMVDVPGRPRLGGGQTQADREYFAAS